MKYFLFIILFLFLPVFFKSYASTKGQVLIINQVRGEDCCDKGNFNNLKLQIDTHIKNGIPAVFALRYDALKNERYVEYLKKSVKDHPDLIRPGILIEVIPNLAKDAEIPYKATEENWFGAENLFTIGYSDEENIKIADILFQKFNDDFDNFPEVTSSWMINTKLLNYLSEKYGVKVHQITREQWGTDSYSLHGGPPHYPYPASSNWVFIPDYQRENAPIIVRQTVTDPLFNYGDSTSSYTSQPNDYLRNKKFDYFEKLTKQALFGQVGTGFALLGLENSMDEKYQKEYVKQIDFLKKLKEEKNITFPDIETLSSFWKNQKISLYQGKDFVKQTPNEAFWITTPAYRIRLLKEADKIFITDIRVYNSNFSDPYATKKAVREGFWVVPYLLDGSMENKTKANLNILSFIKSQPTPVNNFLSVKNDTEEEMSRIELPNTGSNGQLKTAHFNDRIVIVYESIQGKKINLNFTKNGITTIGITPKDFIYKSNSGANPINYVKSSDGFNINWNINNKKVLGLKTSCKNDKCLLSLNSDPKLLDSIRNRDYEYLFPEPANHPLDFKETIVYPNNKYAIAGRNPVRMIIIPYDKYGIVTTLANNHIGIATDAQLKYTYIQQGKRFFVDFYSDNPTFAKASLTLSKDVMKEQNIYFAPNCKANIKTCLANPNYLWWYVNAIAGDKMRQILYEEKQ